MKAVKRLLLFLVLVMLIGCAHTAVPLATPDMDAQAKLFEAPKGKSQIYVFRDSSAFGALVTFDVALNDVPVDNIGSGTYFHFVLPPGSYLIRSKAENTASLHINTEAGRNYFIQNKVRMGILSARNELVEVDEETGTNILLRETQNENGTKKRALRLIQLSDGAIDYLYDLNNQ